MSTEKTSGANFWDKPKSWASTLGSGMSVSRTASPTMMKANVYFVLIVVALLLYCLPLLLIALHYFSYGTEGTPLDPVEDTVQWFVKFATNPDQPGGTFHNILMPLITFIAATSFATAASAGRTLVLSLLILGFIFLAIFMDVAFQVNFTGDASKLAPFFSQISETLTTYLMLILGLQAATVVGPDYQQMVKPKPPPTGGAKPKPTRTGGK
ncbi:hypothetical protein [Methyloligella solikamskensis]|uniref:Uncharacterized protein n=1 Tax=Methyloligella solikamskensis TaxID=1177756 RepID=A0ABW3J8K3_9HYPH